MQREPDLGSNGPAKAGLQPQCRCYGVQILVAGRQKQWRDDVSAQVRRAGYCATTVDCAIDALTVLALGLPVDVLLTDVDLYGDLDCSRLAIEARVMRPNLSIILASDLDEADLVPDAFVLSQTQGAGGVASTLREALAARAA